MSLYCEYQWLLNLFFTGIRNSPSMSLCLLKHVYNEEIKLTKNINVQKNLATA